jgi:hypothetical protein
VAHKLLKGKPARTDDPKQRLKVSRRHHFSERRLPLRQPPAEQPFSASPRNWNPVRNGWVLLLLNFNYFQMRFVDLQPTGKAHFLQVSLPIFSALAAIGHVYT